MIEVTKLNKKKFILNCELIESIESTPDTVITLRNGKLYIVTEPPELIVAMTVKFKQNLFSGLLPLIKRGDGHPEGQEASAE
ncbi:MAG: flagellar FlbD family protein [Oscillospiraceae bacterium]|nr:flagellar FlbD family protein [Oscillospiraceae bacterium]